MKIALAIAKKNILEVLSDKRTIALLFIAPILLMSVVDLLFHVDYKEMNVGYIGDLPKLESEVDVDYIAYDDETIAISELNSGTIQAYVTFDNQSVMVDAPEPINKQIPEIEVEVPNYQIYTNGSDPLFDPLITSAIINSFATDFTSITSNAINDIVNLEDAIMVFVIQFVVFFFAFLIVGISFLHERKSQTLSRMLTYNISKSSIVFGYLIGFGVITIVQSTLIELFAIYALNVNVVGSVFVSILFNSLFALVAIALGSLVSTLASSEFQVMQFIPIILVPQIIFNGTLPYDGLYTYISGIFPITYSYQAQSLILLHDDLNVGRYVIILVGFIMVFSMVNVLVLSKTRKV